MASPREPNGSHSSESIHHGSGPGRPLSDTDIDIQDQATRSTVVISQPVAAPVEDDADDLADWCPRCGSELSDPVNVGWCLRCGYCRYLENAKEIAPLEMPPDPELAEYVSLLRVLGKRLKLALAEAEAKGKSDPNLANHLDLVRSLTRRCRKPGQTAANLREYSGMLRSLGQRLKESQVRGSNVGLGVYEDLLQAMSQKYKEEMDTSDRRSSSFFAALGLPIPALDFIPEWVAVFACGLVICAILSFTAWVNLQGVPNIRFLWCEGQAVLGAVLVLLSHFVAFLTVVPWGLRRKQWGLLIHPRDQWWAVWQRLPDSSFPIWLAGWGLGLFIGAVVMWVV
jgi:hypothetical protein